ncbi:MAG: hypothetical protein DI565_16795 [Ancylobacter novellus]|uniref:DEAD/DEAH box helicase n=1 Tax=Ancylobacter novellus TaxID=921 RepID=A0A2W5K8U5_ANCNO|nr:MAG: hypothetical protein DI565_16795 [Ancylobacter novellus]
MIEAIVASIRSNPNFRSDFEALVTDRLRQTLERIGPLPEPDDPSLERLLQSAGLFGLSADPAAKREAFRIATAAYELYGASMDGLADVLCVILSRLGNFPGLDFRGLGGESRGTLPLPLRIEGARRRLDNTVAATGGPLSLTDYQRALWSDLETGASVACSAPTSAGKSFVILNHIAQELASGAISSVAVIVPTRALVAQVAAALGKLTTGGPGLIPMIRTVPPTERLRGEGSVIYVMTQERLQVMLQDPDFSVDVLAVDEAHQIGEGDRGVVLQGVVDEIVQRRPDLRLHFIMPRMRNPDALPALFGRIGLVRKTVDSPVEQNVVLLEVDPSVPDVVRASLRGSASEKLIFQLQQILVAPAQKLAHLAWFFGRGAQNIVYADGQAACEKVAGLICDVIREVGEIDGSHTEARAELSRLVADHVHPDYPLATTVLSGVGYHYGNIPSLLRTAVERAFDARQLDYVVCTSTLLQGVNLPARNLFMHRPEKGEGKAMGAVDFWNLAGRAGRLGREFEGNVFVIDYAEWKSRPLEEEPEGDIDFALSKTVASTERLLAFIKDREAGANVPADLENTFSRLLVDHRRERLSQTLDRMALDEERRGSIASAIAAASQTMTLPDDVLFANPQISPHRQQRLYTKLVKDVPKKGVDYYMPPHPAGDWDITRERLIDVFRRLQVELDGEKTREYVHWATFALLWMRGEPLPDLIQFEIDKDATRVAVGQEEGKRLRGRAPATIIRKVLKDVEHDLRFRLVKQMSCYNSTLRRVLQDMGKHAAAERIPAIPLFLEVGASSKTMVSFIELGLSRISSSLLQKSASNYDMDPERAKDWLRRNDPTALDLPAACVREVLDLKLRG